ncbi:16383_t:CDS:1 [Acaulospora colombiana]|uniref:16383_t:CDS:1 n=1 Tax=Acaulospora colombiana TaxID=27376 RepID=A0ACA9KFP8_9GLOM|nr:16383_t:CDS:1 [Acaulospora colombiana]
MSSQKSKEVRRLFSTTLQQRQQQKASSSTVSRINHRFAKYEDNDKLICIVCSIQIKNSASWNTHLISSAHKEALKRLKDVKNKVVESSTHDKSKIKNASLSFDTTKKTSVENGIIPSPENDKKRSIETESSDLIDYDSEGKDEEDEQAIPKVKRVKFDVDGAEPEVSADSSLPRDFFDESDSPVEVREQIPDQSDMDIDKTQAKDLVETADQVLPADFFDNPSKASLHKPIRNAIQQETTDEIDEKEWIQFQKLISKETQVSDQIAFVEEEELQRDRDEMLEREQEMCFQRSERLKAAAQRVKENKERRMLDVIEKKSTEGQYSEDDDEQDDGDFENGWMDWRAQRII